MNVKIQMDTTVQKTVVGSLSDQAGNKRNTVYIAFHGVTKSAAMWARDLGVSTDVVHRRFRRNGTPYTNKQLQKLMYNRDVR